MAFFTPYNVSSRQKTFLKLVSMPFAAEPSRIGILQKFVTMPRDTPWYAASEEYGIMNTWQKTYVSAVPPWCNGSTRVFGTLCLGSSPGGGSLKRVLAEKRGPKFIWSASSQWHDERARSDCAMRPVFGSRPAYAGNAHRPERKAHDGKYQPGHFAPVDIPR